MVQIKQLIQAAAQHYRLLEPRIARRQAKKLIRAKAWLGDKAAAVPGSKFQYVPGGLS